MMCVSLASSDHDHGYGNAHVSGYDYESVAHGRMLSSLQPPSPIFVCLRRGEILSLLLLLEGMHGVATSILIEGSLWHLLETPGG